MKECCFNCKHYSYEYGTDGRGYCTYHQDRFSKDGTLDPKSKCPDWEWDDEYYDD